MFKKTFILICATLLAKVGDAQIYTGYNTALTLPAGTVIQDPTPYKLVFQDDFNGTILDRTKWRTYKSWHGMVDNEYWEQARVINYRHVTLLDENVILTGGNCHLILKNKTNSWEYKNCATCPVISTTTHNASTGLLATYHVDPITGKDVSWNLGKFEARMKLPTHTRTHACMWVYHADGTGPSDGVNEIDMAESYGDPYMPGGKSNGNNRRVTSSTHHYKPFMRENIEHYKHMQWWDYVRGRFFNQAEFHTYTCEWDLNRVTFYVDGIVDRGVHKYHTTRSVKRKFFGWHHYKVAAPDVITIPEYYIMEDGFPWAYPTYTDLQFWNGLDVPMGTITGAAIQPPNSSVVIDYVKIWMRQPDGGHVDLCNQNVPKIIGPSIIPSTGGTTFSVDYPVSGASWLSTAAFGLGGSPANISSPTAASCVVSKTSTYSKKFFTLLYSYTKEGCPPQTITKRIEVGEPTKPPVFVVNVNYGNSLKYLQIGATPSVVNTPTTYEWTINYGDQKTYHAFGKHISTPVFANSESDFVNWTLTVSNAIGSSTFTGSKTNNIYLSSHSDTTSEENDTASFYFNALITDTTIYEQVVDSMVSKEYITDSTDTVEINSMVEKIRFQELEPYFLYDSSFNSNYGANYRIAQNPVESITKIYPNPANNVLNIDLGTNYVLEEPKHLVVTNSIGAVVLKKELSNTTFKNTIELNQLASGVYIIEISQKGYSQKSKFTKQ